MARIPCHILTLVGVLVTVTAVVASDERYLLYQVSPTEGFNLRRDVYMRVARVAKHVNWTVVLPPWGPLPHWRGPYNLPWSMFFDVASMNEYTKVIEFNDFMDRFVGDVLLDHVYRLKYAPIQDDLEETYYEHDCGPNTGYRLVGDLYEGDFFGQEGIKARNLTCLYVSGTGLSLADLFEKDSLIMLDGAEVVLHDGFGDAEYWRTRKSMKFAKQLRDEAQTFIRDRLGQDYLAVHLRRSDFPIVRPNDVPSVAGAAAQVRKLMEARALKKVFLATDGDEKEVDEFLRRVPEAVVYHRAGLRFEVSDCLIDNSSRDLCENPHRSSGVAVPARDSPSQCSCNRGDLDKPCRAEEGRCGTVRSEDTVKALPMEEKPLPTGGGCTNEDLDRNLSTKEGGFQPSCGESRGPVDKPCLLREGSCNDQDTRADGTSDPEKIAVHEKVLKTSHEKCENPHQDKGVKAAPSAKYEPKCQDSRSLDQPCSSHEKCPGVPGHSGEPQLAGRCESKAMEKGTGRPDRSCSPNDGTELDVGCRADTCSSKEDARANDYIEGACRPPKPSHLTEGQIAIVDQIICSQAKVFVGSFESTFSFRIQEEREILGKDPDTTFNRLCADGEATCEQPTRWTIVN